MNVFGELLINAGRGLFPIKDGYETSNKKSDNILFSFKFTDFILHIEHKHLNDIGKFAIFSLRMFRDGYSIEEISILSNIEINIIEKQLYFLKEKGYITDKYTLKDEAKNILHLYDFIETNNNTKPTISFEHYIKNKEHKRLFLSNQILNKTETAKGVELDPIIHDYKIKTIFMEINKTSRIIEFLISLYPEFSDAIKANSGEFIFRLEQTNKSYYYNKEISLNNFLNIEEHSDSSMKFALPFHQYKVNSTKDGDETYNWLQNNIEKLNFAQSLLNGERLDSSNLQIIDDSTSAFKLPELLEASDLLNGVIQLPISIFLNGNYKISRFKGHYLKKICEKSFNDLLGN